MLQALAGSCHVSAVDAGSLMQEHSLHSWTRVAQQWEQRTFQRKLEGF
jgi:hypothetical protein